MKYTIYIFVGIAVVAGLTSTLLMSRVATAPTDGVAVTEPVACTMDAMMCADGSFVGRTGPDCEFVCPALPTMPDEVQAHIAAKADLIVLTKPIPGGIVTTPSLVVSGTARGSWFSEGSFPVALTNWDGLIIAEGAAQVQGDWMTTEFVPFSAILTFPNPYKPGDQEVMKRGSLILKKANPSGLPENDDALEVPVRFAE